MSHPPSGKKPEDGARVPANDPPRSVIEFLESRTGEAARINLRDGDSGGASAPVIDPSSKEKLAVPQGRGNYQLMGEVARGGMGVVLKGHDTDLGRDIAVKVLDKRLCERVDVVQRFVEEAQIGGQLQHPGIVPVYELGLMEDERPYFTMKLVKGRTLAALLAAREAPSADRGRLLDIFESVCQTMAYAHSRGVIHRDLKPANIMVGAFGEVQVVDWGLAKVLVRGGIADERRSREAHSHLTVLETVRSDGSGSGTQSLVGSVLGTPAYMPPEQASGQVNRLDERADVFALGAILCEILTGLPPYVGEPAEVIQAASQADLDDALARLDACQADEVLVKATKQCLMPAPSARFADAGVLAERIQAYVISKEERAHRAEVEAAEASVRAEEERKARRLTVALGAALLAVVLVGSGGWLWIQNERADRDRAEAQRRQAAAVQEQALAAEVNEALNEAAVLEGRERWEEAVVAAERALALAVGGGAGDELLAKVDASLTKLRDELAEARRLEEFRKDTQRLLAELREATQPNGQMGSIGSDEQFRQTFLAHGIDLDAGELEVAAEQLTRRGLGSEVALALDAWGDARRVEGDEEGALRLLEIAHLIDPDPDRAHLREAMAVGDLEELRYLAGLGFTGQPANTFSLLATSLVRLGDRELGLSVFRDAVERHPDDFLLNFMLARELTPGADDPGVPEEMREAKGHLRVALSIDPDLSRARFYLARIADKLGDEEEALLEYERAIQLDPDIPPYWYRKAQVLNRLGRWEEASALFERCTEVVDPQWIQGWSINGLANIEAIHGDKDRALELAREAWLTGASRNRFVRVWMLSPYATITAMTGEPAPLLEAREQFELEFAGYAAANSRFARVLWKAAAPPDDDLIRTYEVTPEGRELLLTHAVEIAREGLEIDPENDGLWHELGGVLYELGDAEGAVDAFTREDELDEMDDARNWFDLAKAHDAQGDSTRARAWYDRGISWIAVHPEQSSERIQSAREEAARALGLE